MMNRVESQADIVKNSVPQGKVLAPILLFILLSDTEEAQIIAQYDPLQTTLECWRVASIEDKANL